MLKKMLATLALVVGLQGVSFATYNEIQMCPNEPYPVGGTLSGFLSNASGTNFLLTKIVEAAAQKELRKEFDSKFNIELHAFGGKNLLDGKFKAIKVASKKVVSDEVNATNFSAASLCNYNHITIKNDELNFVENFLMEYSAQITSEDLQRTILSPSYTKLLNKLNVNVAGFSLFKISDPSIGIKNNRLQMSAQVSGLNIFSPVQIINEIGRAHV